MLIVGIMMRIEVGLYTGDCGIKFGKNRTDFGGICRRYTLINCSSDAGFNV